MALDGSISRWFGYAFIAMSALVLQTTIAPKIEFFGARPDWLVVIVVFFALHARTSDSVFVGWGVGLFADLATLGPLGLLSLSFGGAALAVAWMKDYVFRFQVITQLALTFIVCALLHLAWLFVRWKSYGLSEGLMTVLARDVFLTSLYTAAWAPFVHRGLLRFARPLGIPRPRYLYTMTR